LEHLRKLSEKPYRVNRSTLIPGFDEEGQEFMAQKPWAKRLVYHMVSRYPWLDWRAHRHYFKKWLDEAIADHHLRTRQLVEGLGRLGLADKLRRFNHHDTHAANAFYASGYENALLLTLDGYGSGNCGGVYVGDQKGIKPLHRFAFPNSLGSFYEMVTSALGFRPSRHEGKIVGLAAYGDATLLRDVLLDRFDCSDGDIKIKASLNALFTRGLTQRYAKRDVAAAYQTVLELVSKQVVAYWLKKTGLRNIAVSGGVHANVKLNQRLREIEGVDSVFVYPNMGDGGCGTGAAMMLFGAKMFEGQPLDNVYFGPKYSDRQITEALDRNNLHYDQVSEIEDRIAHLLTEDHIIGRFNGRMEYGPRALGNRSVLYPAREPEVNQWLNHQLGRTEFMPFAPAALASESNRLFKSLSGCEKTAEFMTMTFDCTHEMIGACPAAVHVDGTARPQLVSEGTNPSFHRILRGYYERTGIPALINTSFNMHEEPIVCSPEDAIRAFLMGNIDYLAISDFLVPHPRLRDLTKQRRQEVAV
jgi:carbamoyltransferase